MQVLVIVLNKTDFLEKILAILVERHVKGATILSSQGMGSAIVNDEYTSIPLFGSLKNVLKQRHPYNKTIFSVIHDEAILEAVIRDIENLVAEVDEPGIGLLFTVPVGHLKVLGKKNGT